MGDDTDAKGRGGCLARVLNAVRGTGRCVAFRQSEGSAMLIVTDLKAAFHPRLKMRVIGDPDEPGPWLDLIGDLERAYMSVHGRRPQPADGRYTYLDEEWPSLRLRDVVDVMRSAVADAVRASDGGLIRDWYLEKFPDDPIGGHIDKLATFSDLLEIARGDLDPGRREDAAFGLLGIPDTLIAELALDEMRRRFDVSEVLPTGEAFYCRERRCILVNDLADPLDPRVEVFQIDEAAEESLRRHQQAELLEFLHDGATFARTPASLTLEELPGAGIAGKLELVPIGGIRDVVDALDAGAPASDLDPAPPPSPPTHAGIMEAVGAVGGNRRAGPAGVRP